MEIRMGSIDTYFNYYAKLHYCIFCVKIMRITSTHILTSIQNYTDKSTYIFTFFQNNINM